MAVNTGTAGRWKQAQDFAAAGKMGKAREAMEKGGGTWDLDIHKNLKFGTPFPKDEPAPDPTPEPDPPDTSAADALAASQKALEAMQAQQAADRDARAQEKASNIAAAAKAKTDRMNYWKGRNGLGNTLLSGLATNWMDKYKKRRSYLSPWLSRGKGRGRS